MSSVKLYSLIQGMFPSFSIERIDILSKKLTNGLNNLNSDQRLVYEALNDASEYEIYAEGTDVTIASPDELDLPYPYIEIRPGIYSIVLDDPNTIIALLEISNLLKFRTTNRNTFTIMNEEGEKYLPFNEELYNKYSKKISLEHVYSYASKIRKNRSNRHPNTITYINDSKVILEDSLPARLGDRREYENICLSMSQLL